jgi:hypothetical protein
LASQVPIQAASINVWSGANFTSISNPQEGDIGRELLARILRQAGRSAEVTLWSATAFFMTGGQIVRIKM